MISMQMYNSIDVNDFKRIKKKIVVIIEAIQGEKATHKQRHRTRNTVQRLGIEIYRGLNLLDAFLFNSLSFETRTLNFCAISLD